MAVEILKNGLTRLIDDVDTQLGNERKKRLPDDPNGAHIIEQKMGEITEALRTVTDSCNTIQGALKKAGIEDPPPKEIFGEGVIFERLAEIRPENLPWQLDPEADTISIGGETHSLGFRQFDILVRLAAARGEFVPIKNLIADIEGVSTEDVTQAQRNLYTAYVRRLRNKIENDPSKPRVLITGKGKDKGKGYRLTLREENRQEPPTGEIFVETLKRPVEAELEVRPVIELEEPTAIFRVNLTEKVLVTDEGKTIVLDDRELALIGCFDGVGAEEYILLDELKESAFPGFEEKKQKRLVVDTVSSLREKLGDDGRYPTILLTRWGKGKEKTGYAFSVPILITKESLDEIGRLVKEGESLTFPQRRLVEILRERQGEVVRFDELIRELSIRSKGGLRTMAVNTSKKLSLPKQIANVRGVGYMWREEDKPEFAQMVPLPSGELVSLYPKVVYFPLDASLHIDDEVYKLDGAIGTRTLNVLLMLAADPQKTLSYEKIIEESPLIQNRQGIIDAVSILRKLHPIIRERDLVVNVLDHGYRLEVDSFEIGLPPKEEISWWFDEDNRILFIGRKTVILGKAEARVLATLIEATREGEFLTSRQIYARIHKIEKPKEVRKINPSQLSSVLGPLRQIRIKIEENPREPKLLLTLPYLGFVWHLPFERESSPSAPPAGKKIPKTRRIEPELEPEEVEFSPFETAKLGDCMVNRAAAIGKRFDRKTPEELLSTFKRRWEDFCADETKWPRIPEGTTPEEMAGEVKEGLEQKLLALSRNLPLALDKFKDETAVLQVLLLLQGLGQEERKELIKTLLGVHTGLEFRQTQYGLERVK